MVFITLWLVTRLCPGLKDISLVSLISLGVLSRGVCLFLLLPALKEISDMHFNSRALLVFAGLALVIFLVTAVMSRAGFDRYEGILAYNTFALLITASCLGLWLSSEIQKAGHLLPLCIIAAGVDYLSVARGPSSAVLDQLEQHAQMVSAGIPHHPPLVSYLILRYPQLGSGLDMMIGVGDLAFFGLLVGAVVKFGLPRINIPLLAFWGFLASLFSIALYFSHGISGIPALPFIGIGFIIINVRKMKLDRTEWLITLSFVIAIIITGIALGVWVR